MTETPSQLQSTVAADEQALAASDLTALQAAQATLTNASTTVAQVNAVLAALPGQLGDPGRIATAGTFASNLAQLYNQLATLISETNAVANPAA